MDFESPDVEKDFPGLYASDPSRQNQDRESDYSDESHDKPSKKDLLIGKRKERKESKKDKGYVAFEEESSGEDVDAEQKSPTKSRKGKSAFKFSKRDKSKEKTKEKKEDRKEEKEKEKKKESKVKLKLKDRKKPKHVEDESDKADHVIFGVPLNVAVERNKCHDGIELPAIVRECIDYIEEHGLSCEGIYRLSGVKSKVVKLKNMYNHGEQVYLYEHEPHIIASLLKLFLRELPDPVLTNELMPKFEEASAMKDSKKKVEVLKKLIEDLPVCNRTLLSWIFVHMGHIIERESVNKMNVQNVSIVLSPTLQISHRVLNAFFTHGSDLFRGVILKKYALPLKQELSRSSLELPESPSAIETEIAKQESLLSQLHADVFSGVADREKEEQLWEVQRIVTQLKRNLRLAKRTQITQEQANVKHGSSLAVEELNLQIDKRLQVVASEQPPSLQVDTNHKCTVYVQWQPEVQENEPETTTPEVSNVADNGVVVVSNIDVDDDVNDELSKDRIDESKKSEDDVVAPKPLTPEIEDVQSDKEDVQEADEKADISKSVTTEDSGRENVELEELVNEEKTLLVQQDELCQLAGELKRKIENERSEVGRLRTKMQELRILYRYHSLSCDSAENSSDEDCSDSEDEGDEEVEEEEEESEESMLQTLADLQMENKDLEQQNKDLIEKIQLEREACLDAKIQIRMLQIKQEVLTQKTGKEKGIF